MNREKFYRLTVHTGFDKYEVPIYEAAARKRCRLLKTLMSSHCINNCKFCLFRTSREVQRDRWRPEELARVTMKLWKERRIEGLFLSSGFDRDPDLVADKQLETIRILRVEGFKAYVHLRLMPGVSLEKIREAVELCDRVGINIEAPKAEYYHDLKIGPVSFIQDVIHRMKLISREIGGKKGKSADTQMIVDACDDQDREILRRTEELYKELKLARVYYSGFEPIHHTPLESRAPCGKMREYNLYKASFLIRDYGFSYKDLVYDEGNLIEEDPKLAFARANEDIFPIDINSAPYHELLLIPGIGPRTARKIVENRPILSVFQLRKVTGRDLRDSIQFLDIQDQTTLKNFT